MSLQDYSIGSSRALRLVRVTLGVVAAIVALCLIDWRSVAPSLGAALSKATSLRALGLATVGQVLSLGTCAAGLAVLSPQLSASASVWSRWVRDGVGAIPFGLPGMGEAASVRILVLFGITGSDAVAITTADVLAETLSQAAYALTAVLLAPSSLKVSAPSFSPDGGVVILGTIVALAAIVLSARLAPANWRRRLVAVVRRTWALVRSPRFAGSLALHAVAWVLGGIQIYLLSQMLGAHLTLLQGLSLEGLVFALRAAFFFVPAGVSVQEAGLATVGAAYGLAPVDAAALALLLRLRDLVVLAPALAGWAAWEVRRAIKPACAPPPPTSDIGTLPCA